MPSQEKKDKVRQIRKWFDGAESVLVLHYSGLRVSEANDLRGIVGQNGAELRVLKNTLTRIALSGSPHERLTELLEGPVAVVFAGPDPTPVARALRDFARGRKQFYMLGGLVSERLLDGRQVEAVATLPAREVLLAQMAGVMQAPLAKIVSAVVAPARKMLGLFQALADKKTAAEPAPVEVVPEQVAPELEAPPAEEAQAGPETAEPIDEAGVAAAEDESPQAEEAEEAEKAVEAGEEQAPGDEQS